jgi:hypothetical protein
MTDKDCRGSFILRCSCYHAMVPTKYLRLLCKYSSSKQLFSYVDKIVGMYRIFFNTVHTSRGRTERFGN